MSLPTLKSNFSTRKHVYEAAIERRRRIDEDHRQTWNQNANYYVKEGNKSQLINKWTSDSSFNSSLKSYLSDAAVDEERVSLVAQRRKRMQALYDAEASQQEYELMKLRQPENRKTLEQLRQKAEQYQKRNEQELAQIAESKFQQHSRENDPKNREIRREEDRQQTVGTWAQQIDQKNQQEYPRRDHEEREREISLAEMSRLEAERDREYLAVAEKQRLEKERAKSEHLSRQIAELRESEQIAQMLLAEEEQLMRQQSILEAFEAEKKVLDSQRVSRNYGRALLKQHNAALRKKSQEVQAELERDLSWLARLEEAAVSEQTGREEQKQMLRMQLGEARSCIEKDLRLEKAREAEIDKLFIQEAKEIWRKREHEWRQEAEARERLLEDVLTQRRHQVMERLARNRDQQMMDIEEREKLLNSLEQTRIEDSPRVKEYPEIAPEEARQQTQPTSPRDSESRNHLMEQAYERRLRKEAQRLRSQANSSVISGRPSNYALEQLKRSNI